MWPALRHKWFQLCFKDRISAVLGKPCKCREGKCYSELSKADVTQFLDGFEKLGKLEQDSFLVLACADQSRGMKRDYMFLSKAMKRSCFERILGMSSHRLDKLGQPDLRFGHQPTKPTVLTASIDSFCCVLYNSVAEPLPDRCWWREDQKKKTKNTNMFCFLVWNHLVGLMLIAQNRIDCHRLVRQGQAKRRPDPAADEDSDNWGPGGIVYFSEFEENDADLAQYLRSDSSFLVAMSLTGAFSAIWLYFKYIFLWRRKGLTKRMQYYLTFLIVKDLSALVRKYLPPGTIFETYQFYLGWCDAHDVNSKASYCTFLRHWNRKWTNVLKFRDQTSFSQCDVCSELKAQHLTFAQRLQFFMFVVLTRMDWTVFNANPIRSG